MSQVQQQEGTQERLRETKFAVLIGPKEAEAQHAKRSQGEVLRERTQQEDREETERERTCEQVLLSGVRVEYTSKKCQGISLVCFNVSR